MRKENKTRLKEAKTLGRKLRDLQWCHRREEGDKAFPPPQPQPSNNKHWEERSPEHRGGRQDFPRTWQRPSGPSKPVQRELTEASHQDPTSRVWTSFLVLKSITWAVCGESRCVELTCTVLFTGHKAEWLSSLPWEQRGREILRRTNKWENEMGVKEAILRTLYFTSANIITHYFGIFWCPLMSHSPHSHVFKFLTLLIINY